MNTILLIVLIILITIDLVFNFMQRDIQSSNEEEINASDCIVEEPKSRKLSKEDQEKMEKTKKAFDNLMGYGYEDAIKRK